MGNGVPPVGAQNAKSCRSLSSCLMCLCQPSELLHSKPQIAQAVRGRVHITQKLLQHFVFCPLIETPWLPAERSISDTDWAVQLCIFPFQYRASSYIRQNWSSSALSKVQMVTAGQATSNSTAPSSSLDLHGMFIHKYSYSSGQACPRNEC